MAPDEDEQQAQRVPIKGPFIIARTRMRLA